MMKIKTIFLLIYFFKAMNHMGHVTNIDYKFWEITHFEMWVVPK